MIVVDSIETAAAGRLPEWAEVKPARTAHIARVAALMDDWAGALGLDAAECGRWRTAAWLHDALRDADPDRLRAVVPPRVRDLPDQLLHGPAVASRLRDEGVHDEGLLTAVAYHTTGHPQLDLMGRMLFLADFLEPGRTFEPALRAALRSRMPGSMAVVLREVVALRICYLVRRGSPIRPESVAFWNAVVSA